MRKLLPALLLTLTATPLTSGELPSTGYYRVQNRTTTRYAYVRDNKGKIDYGATTADYDAIWLIKGEERTHYDPSCIIYFNHRSGYEYDLEAQGTSVYEIIDMLPHIYAVGDYYKIGGTASGTTKYLSDGESNLYIERSFPRDAGGDAAKERQKWDIYPVADSYFGIMPTVTVEGGKGYATFYADFPYAMQSQGMKAYAVVKVGYGQAAIREVSGTIPNATPLLVEVSGATASDNRLAIGGAPTATPPADNQLVGVYFQNTHSRAHWNVVEYDPTTMRVLGLTADGQPGFITAGSDLAYIDANTAYLVVPEGTDAELRIVLEDQFTIPDPDPEPDPDPDPDPEPDPDPDPDPNPDPDPDPDPSGINEAPADASGVSIAIDGLTVSVKAHGVAEIYDITGRKVASLPAGGGCATVPHSGIYLLRTPAAVSKLLF